MAHRKMRPSKSIWKILMRFFFIQIYANEFMKNSIYVIHYYACVCIYHIVGVWIKWNPIQQTETPVWTAATEPQSTKIEPHSELQQWNPIQQKWNPILNCSQSISVHMQQIKLDTWSYTPKCLTKWEQVKPISTLVITENITTLLYYWWNKGLLCTCKCA